MKRFLILILAFVIYVSTTAPQEHPRPKILGIAAVHFYTTNLPAARKFYSQVIDPSVACYLCEEHAADPIVIRFTSGQTLTFDLAKNSPRNLLIQIDFATDDVNGMRQYLQAQGVRVTPGLAAWPASRTFPFASVAKPPNDCELCGLTVSDPEGHHIGFMRLLGSRLASEQHKDPRIIHAGFVVHDRAAEDHFYKDILGFHLYWHGGMKDDTDDWVAMQVPDGTDWIEYMLNIPSNASNHTLGVMNHMALGVTDIQATDKLLIESGWTPGDPPRLGRDGKWQLNVYDPDDTRIEFMEFTPKEKPCCSAFTGPHPGPPQ